MRQKFIIKFIFFIKIKVKFLALKNYEIESFNQLN